MGKPYQELVWDVDDTAGCLEYYAAQAEALDKRQWSNNPTGNPTMRSRLRYDPVGVCAAVIPFVRVL